MAMLTGKISASGALYGKVSGSGTLHGQVSAGGPVVGSGESVQQYATYLNFPKLGKLDVVYIDKGANAIYRWNDTDLKYYCVGRDYTEIDLISGGTAHGK